MITAAIILALSCSISNPPPTLGSKEEQVRKQLKTIEELASNLETTAYQLESFMDELRKNPNDEKTRVELQRKIDTLSKEYQKLRTEINSWEQNLNPNTE